MIEHHAQGSRRAEEAVIGALLRSEDARLEVISGGLEPDDFYHEHYKLVYEQIIERYFADEPIDALVVAEQVGPRLGDEPAMIDKLIRLSKIDTSDMTPSSEHASIIKRHADFRRLVSVASDAIHNALEQEQEPEEIAGVLSAAATKIVTGSVIHNEWLSYADLGRRWTAHMRAEMEAKAAGTELGAYFSVAGIDSYVKGMRPTELMMLGGDPGVGKSAIAWVMARNFAQRQLKKDKDKRVGAAIFSLEMGEELSSGRFAQVESDVEGERLRTVVIGRGELREIATKWARNRELPLWVNHSGALRLSQLKAMCIDAIRRHRVGLVVIDHFRFLKPDEKYQNRNDADDEIVAFLKSLAKDLNLAVICLAHTTKNDDRRPVMDDLRGSKMISAFADLVVFPYWPWKHATQSERERGLVSRFDYELIFDKVRQGAPGTAELYVDMSTMTIR